MLELVDSSLGILETTWENSLSIFATETGQFDFSDDRSTFMA